MTRQQFIEQLEATMMEPSGFVHTDDGQIKPTRALAERIVEQAQEFFHTSKGVIQIDAKLDSFLVRETGIVITINSPNTVEAKRALASMPPILTVRSLAE